MTVTIVGSQFGDEGKGGIVDVYGEAADIVVRYQGGDNAGHTVVHEGREYALSLVPSGVVRGKIGVLGNGCVVNPETLFSEIDELRNEGLDPDIRVAERAHVIFPFHRVLDGLEEEAKSDDLTVGTTGRGIGPTYEDKAGRRGVRVGDLLEPDALREHLEYVVPQKRALVESFGGDPDDPGHNGAFDVDAVYEEYREFGRRLADETMTVDSGPFLAERRGAGDRIMFEGAQGTGIDVDHGSYPNVTSSNPTAGGATVGSGLAPGVIGDGEVVGIVKAYLSRVGTGPMPTELGFVEGQTTEGAGNPAAADVADAIRERGGEFGTVTGRPRRVGWLDVPLLRHAARTSGFTGIAVNHLDVLAGMDPVKVGHAYELDGEELYITPPTVRKWAECDVVYREFDGWPDVNWSQLPSEGYDALPANAQTYLEYVSDEMDAPVYAVGVGPERAETIIAEDVWN